MQKKLEDYFIIQNGKKLYYGYTTGSCAAAAAKAACEMLLSDEQISNVSIDTPFGIELYLDVLEVNRKLDNVTCAIKKYAGDDPDATDGILVYATVCKIVEREILIDGGIGVGRVSREGLEQPVGNAAINNASRMMIQNEITSVCQKYDYTRGISVVISIPEGVEISKKTFNPRLGIEGGISVLGTSGIVVPMSEEALVKSIEVEMKIRLAHDEYLLATPGNYGGNFLKEKTKLPFEKNIKCSNFIGKTIEMATNNEAKGILFISNIGKFIKVAGGIMDTHSKSADCRAEILTACAIRAGCSLELAKELLEIATTEEGLDILHRNNFVEPTMNVMMEKIDFYLKNKSDIEVGAIVFSNKYGFLGQTSSVTLLSEKLSEK